MEPRWSTEWSYRDYMRFVGGTPEADLWVVFHHGGFFDGVMQNIAAIRVSMGESDPEWDWFHWDMYTGLRVREVATSNLRNKAIAYVSNPENKKLIETYLRLFVPEITMMEN